MKKMYKFGVHTFYRPRNWGDGSDAPSWGTPAQTAEISAKHIPGLSLAVIRDSKYKYVHFAGLPPLEDGSFRDRAGDAF